MSRTAHNLRYAIEQDIVTGAFAPGERLDETTLAERFKVSRTPIREALNALETSGLIELRPRRGAFVRAIGPKELMEMFETLAALEAACAGFAAQRIDAAGEAGLREAVAVCDAAVADPDLYFDANEVFHERMWAAAGNAYLVEQTTALSWRLQAYRRLQLRVRGRISQSRGEHHAIVEAIAAGDVAAATERARAHKAVQGDRFMALLDSLSVVSAA